MKKPIILFEGKNTLADLEHLKKDQKIWKVVDTYTNQLRELFEITNPALKKGSGEYNRGLEIFLANKTSESKLLRGNWIYYPWSGVLVHTVNENEYFQLRTNRNQNLITKSEQEKLYNSCIGIIGLSVGGGIATGLAFQGIAKNLKISEFDQLETSNLNRMRADMSEIGDNKIDIISRQVYEVNPYVDLFTYPNGVKNENLLDFINSDSKPDVIFEIVDDFEMKIRVRMEARKAGIPVVGPANLGDRILLDIERYDLEPDLPLVNGVLGELPEKILENPNEDKNKYAVAMVGPENIPARAVESVKEIGKTLVGRPQLSSTVTISGAVGVYIARKILLEKEFLKSGRYLVNLDTLFSK